MTAILDTPVKPVGVQNTLSVGLLRCSAGNAIGYIIGLFACFFVYGLPLDDKSLPDMREVEVVVEFGGNPDFAGFDPAMVRRVTNNEIGLFAILEV